MAFRPTFISIPIMIEYRRVDCGNLNSCFLVLIGIWWMVDPLSDLQKGL